MHCQIMSGIRMHKDKNVGNACLTSFSYKQQDTKIKQVKQKLQNVIKLHIIYLFHCKHCMAIFPELLIYVCKIRNNILFSATKRTSINTCTKGNTFNTIFKRKTLSTRGKESPHLQQSSTIHNKSNSCGCHCSAAVKDQKNIYIKGA